MKSWRWCIFCRVIDNYGDAGVCLRLATELAHRGQSVELWIDQAEILEWMSPELPANLKVIRWEGVGHQTPSFQSPGPRDVIIEAFGCEIPQNFQTDIAKQSINGIQKTQWINLEYLSAEDFAIRNHGLVSPILSGAGEGAHKWFYYPGFSPLTGGLIVEERTRQKINRPAPQKSNSGPFNVGLFCYADAPMDSLIGELIKPQNARSSVIHIPSGGNQKIMNHLVEKRLAEIKTGCKQMELRNLDSLTQINFDEMLWNNDLNFVRGEDSLIRAIWVGKPWIWQIYKQSDNVHFAKLNALLEQLECPSFVKEIHWGWNQYLEHSFTLPALDDQEKWAKWSTWCIKIRSKLLEQADLVTQLISFVDEKRQKTVES